MKIGTVKLLNLQSHERNSFTLSPFLNATVGTTDVGKSAFLRGIIQLVTNKLKWNDLRRWDTKTTNIIISGISGDVIKRIKSDKRNVYVVNGKELATVRTDVPDQVYSALNLSSVNIQQQKESWFLIDKGAGTISKEINKVAGLSVMDDSIQAVNKEIRDIKARIRSDNNFILELDTAIQGLDWLDAADVELTRLEKIEKNLNEIDATIKFLENTLSDIEREEKRLSRLISPQISKEIKSIFSDFRSVQDAEEEIEELETLLKELEAYKVKLEKTETINTDELELLHKQILETEEQIEEIEDMLSELEELNDECEDCNLQLKNVNTKLKRIKVCPTCNTPFRHKEIK